MTDVGWQMFDRNILDLMANDLLYRLLNKATWLKTNSWNCFKWKHYNQWQKIHLYDFQVASHSNTIECTHDHDIISNFNAIVHHSVTLLFNNIKRTNLFPGNHSLRIFIPSCHFKNTKNNCVYEIFHRILSIA